MAVDASWLFMIYAVGFFIGLGVGELAFALGCFHESSEAMHYIREMGYHLGLHPVIVIQLYILSVAVFWFVYPPIVFVVKAIRRP